MKHTFKHGTMVLPAGATILAAFAYKHTLFVDDLAHCIIYRDRLDRMWIKAWGTLKPNKRTYQVANINHPDELGGLSWTKVEGDSNVYVNTYRIDDEGIPHYMSKAKAAVAADIW